MLGFDIIGLVVWQLLVSGVHGVSLRAYDNKPIVTVCMSHLTLVSDRQGQPLWRHLVVSRLRQLTPQDWTWQVTREKLEKKI
ncbi:hypothetical protein RRG08_053480 [Elysia crispata]|uniref:Uncharacterized protein n=1 Tax=Elysia crispata TaxID=231223 RepID=A0AAE1DQI7_9GAST|nr:hypothetical protein RRG08_053480 [Elysia crispata]